MPTDEKVEFVCGDKTHDWFTPEHIRYECCRRCGIIRRADRKNKPCRGPVSVGPRAAERVRSLNAEQREGA